MGRPKLYHTDEERQEARRRANAKYHLSEKGQEAMRRANADPKAKERYARYRTTEKYRAAQERFKASGGRNRLAMKHRAKVREERPEVLTAWSAVANALREGRLSKPDACNECGRDKHLVAHHHLGYTADHQLDVQWLCRPCHKAAHAIH